MLGRQLLFLTDGDPGLELLEEGEKACHKQAAIDLRQQGTFPVSCDCSPTLDVGLPVN